MIVSTPANDKITKNKRILVVDDEETLRLSIEQVLSENGYDVTTAKNGAEALELAHSGGFDLIITDLRMPGLSGLQLISEIKKTDPLTKIIVVSAYGSMEAVIEAMRMGVNDFVAKPFKVKSMKEVVANVLGATKKNQRETPAIHPPIEAGGGTADTKERDSLLIRSNLSYYLDPPQDYAFFDAVDIAEKKVILIFGSTSSNVVARCNVPLLSTMVRTIFRAAVEDESHNPNHPKHIVEKINNYLCFNTKPRIPVSLFCALVDKNKGVIEYVNHGQKVFCCLLQDPPEAGKITTLESCPYPLNQFPDIYIEEKTSSITGESRLILVSSDSLTALPIADCEMRIANAVTGVWQESEIVRKIRANILGAASMDNDLAIAIVDLQSPYYPPLIKGDEGGLVKPKQEKIIIPAATKDFRGIVSWIENILKGFALSPQKEHGIVTAINEAIINAKLFAYNNHGNAETGDIIVTVALIGKELVIEVFDKGRGFNVQSYKKPDFTDYQSITRERGRGIFLIQKLMDRVMIQSSENIGTRVYMSTYLS